MRKTNKYVLLILFGLCNAIMYSFPYLRYVFYDQQIAAMHITNEQSGFLLTLYAGVSMIFYVPGGILADRFATKKSILVSMCGSFILIIAYCTTFNYVAAEIIWVLLSLSTNFVFWCALTKAVRQVGDDSDQGRSYGIYYASSGLFSAVLNAACLFVYSRFSNEVTGFRFAMLTMAAGTLITAILVFLLFKDNGAKKVVTSSDDKFNVKDVVTVIKNPLVWAISLTVFSAYGLYTSVSYFSPYLTDVLGVPIINSSAIGIIRSNLMCLMAPVGGLLADRVFKSTSKWFIGGFALTIAVYTNVLLLPKGVNVMYATILSLLPAALSMMVYGVVYSTVQECRIPRHLTGTVVGIASIIGYLPDFFFYVMFGRWMDQYKNAGYRYIFLFLLCVAILGLILSVVIRISTKNKKIPETEGTAQA